MADAYGKLTGRPGICLVTRGPGATHASIGVHTASQDSTPMILLVGQVARDAAGREASRSSTTAPVREMAKWVAQIDDAARVPELVARAFARDVRAAGAGRARAARGHAHRRRRRADAARTAPSPPRRRATRRWRAGELLERRGAAAGDRRRGRLDGADRTDVAAFCEAQRIPVAASFRCQDYVDNRSPAYAGHAGLGMDPALAARIRDADVLLAIGGRLSEITTDGYTLLRRRRRRSGWSTCIPTPACSAPCTSRSSHRRRAGGFAAAAAKLAPARHARALLEAAHAEYERTSQEVIELPGALQMSASWRRCASACRDAILTQRRRQLLDLGHRYYQFRRHGTQLAPRSGSMGYGVPAAVAAKVVHPDAPWSASRATATSS